MYLIVGASGTVGSRVARRLVDRGDVVRVVSRDPRRLETLQRRGALPIAGDLRSTDWMPAALTGVRCLILSSHGLVPPSRDNHPGIVDDAGNRRIIDAAQQAGVERIIFISAASVAGQHTLFTAAKHRVEDHLKSTGLSHAVIRPTVFIETHALLLMADPLRTKGSVQFFGPGTAVLNWVSANDVADYVVKAVDAPANFVHVIGGPDNLSRRQVLELIEHALGRTARRSHVPASVMRIMHAVVGSIHPGMRYLLDLALAETTARDAASSQVLDWTGPTSVAEVVGDWVRN